MINSQALSKKKNLSIVSFLNLSEEWESIGKEVESSLLDLLYSGSFILGAHLSKFEVEFANFLSVKGVSSYVIGCASGTEAIALALKVLGIQSGKTVLTVANSCAPTAVGIRMTGADLKFMDVDPIHLMIDPEKLENRLAQGDIDAVVVVNLYGNTPPLDQIVKTCHRYGVKLVEDSAQAHGARFKDQPAGTFGDAAAFSFYPSKNLGAYGDGGAVVTRDENLAARLLRLRNYGYDPSKRDWALEEGFNSRLDEIQAAVLSVKLKYLEIWNERRRFIASLYDRVLQGRSDIFPVVPIPSCQPSRHLYVVRCRKREKLSSHLAASGIPTQIHYPYPIHLQPAYRFLEYQKGAFPISEEAAQEILSIPLHPFMTNEMIEQVVEAFRTYS